VLPTLTMRCAPRQVTADDVVPHRKPYHFTLWLKILKFSGLLVAFLLASVPGIG
jgi:hypothetical protein